MSCLSNITRSHVSELGYDLSHGIGLSREELHATETDRLIKVCDGLHVLQFEEDGVLETFQQQVVVFLLHDVAVLCRHLLCLEQLKDSFTINLVLLLSLLALRLLLLACGVDLDLLGSDLALERVHVHLDLIDFLAKCLLVVSLKFLLLKGALLAELVDLEGGLLELLLMLGFLLHLAHLQVALLGIKAPVKLLKEDGILHDHLLKSSLLDVLFTELGLHVLEQP